jgi:hypothetical protein
MIYPGYQIRGLPVELKKCLASSDTRPRHMTESGVRCQMTPSIFLAFFCYFFAKNYLKKVFFPFEAHFIDSLIDILYKISMLDRFCVLRAYLKRFKY